MALSLVAACAAELEGEPDADSGDELPRTGEGAGLTAAPTLHRAYTEYLGQLTGRSPNPYPAAMRGTDLGISFQGPSKLYFLFGDTWTDGMVFDGEFNRDTIASAPISGFNPGAIPRLSWYTRTGGRWSPFSIQNVSNDLLKEMSVPVEGISVGNLNYIFYHADFDTNTRLARKSILAHASGEAFASPLVLDHIETNSKKFLSVSAVKEGTDIYIFGAGQYRRSPVHLAKVSAPNLPFRDRWQYWNGSTFVAGEDNAQPVMTSACVGELSVRKHASLGYLMAYNCAAMDDDPNNKVVLRTASAPQGPWTEPIELFKRADAAGRFMHVEQAGADDGLRESYELFQDWKGDIYGPYLIPAWFDEPGPGLHGIVYTLSTFIPYNVYLMRTVLAEPGYDASAPTRGTPAAPKALSNPDFANGSLNGWTAEGDAFFVFQDGFNANKWTVSTYTQAKRTSVRGKLWQEFTVPASASSLTFQVHGGRNASVALLDGSDSVRRTTGRNTNDGRIQVTWNLELLRGKRVRLQIEDNATDTWGFVGTSGFTLR